MNSLDSQSLSQTMGIPFKFLQKLSLSQTDCLAGLSRSIPTCFQDTLLRSVQERQLVSVLENAGINVRDLECPLSRLISCLLRGGIVCGVTTEEQKLMNTLLSPNRRGFANVPLLILVWEYWFRHKNSLLPSSVPSSSSQDMAPSSSSASSFSESARFHQCLEYIRLRHTDLEYTIGIVGERLSSVLTAQDLDGIRGLVLDRFMDRCTDIGLLFSPVRVKRDETRKKREEKRETHFPSFILSPITLFYRFSSRICAHRKLEITSSRCSMPVGL